MIDSRQRVRAENLDDQPKIRAACRRMNLYGKAKALFQKCVARSKITCALAPPSPSEFTPAR